MKNNRKNILLLKIIALSLHRKSNEKTMKYSEIHRKLRKAGCYPTGHSIAGHPEWYSPITDTYFPTSHHESEEAKRGTQRNIERQSGVKL